MAKYISTPAKNVQTIVNLGCCMKISPSCRNALSWDDFAPLGSVNVEKVRLIRVALAVRIVPGKNDNFILPHSHAMPITTTGLITTRLNQLPTVRATVKTPHFVATSLSVVSTAPEVDVVTVCDDGMAVAHVRLVVLFLRFYAAPANSSFFMFLRG